MVFPNLPQPLPPPLPLSLSLFSLCSLDHVQMFPATTTLQNSQKERARRAASCRRVDKQTWRGGGGHVRRPGRRGPQGAPRPPPPPRPGAGPWEDTVLGPQGLKDGRSLPTPGSWPHWGPGGGRGRGKSGQSFGNGFGLRRACWESQPHSRGVQPRGSHVSTRSVCFRARARAGSFQ